jgi:hypothetical protein
MNTSHVRSARRPLLALAALFGALLAAAAIAQSAVGLAAHEGDRTVAFGDVDDGYLDVEVAPDWLGEAEASLTLSDGTTVTGTLDHAGSGWLTFRPDDPSADAEGIQFDVYLADAHGTTARIELDDSVGSDADDGGPSGEGTTPNGDDEGGLDDGTFDDDDEAGPTVVIRSGDETIGYGDLDDGRLDVELLPGRDGAITITFDPGDGSGVVTYTGTVSDGEIVVDGTRLEEIAGLPVSIELDDSVEPDDDARDGRPGDDEARRGDDDDDVDDDSDDDADDDDGDRDDDDGDDDGDDRDDDADDADGDRDDDEDGDRDDDADDEGEDADPDRDDDEAETGDDDGDDLDEEDEDDDEDDEDDEDEDEEDDDDEQDD